jgi:L-ascorbate metabolism protein UlaG (beta-lactamase superfamily)
MTYTYKNLIISKYDHDTVTIEREGAQTCYVFDPFQTQGIFRSSHKASAIFISHDHFDHFSPKDILPVVTSKTKYLFPTSILDKIQMFLDVPQTAMIPVVPLEEYQLEAGGTTVSCMAVPAYNVDKKSSQGNLYHPKEKGYVGFLLSIDGTSVYFAGDTDPIPEMEVLIGAVEVLLLPISGVYVMTLEEAVALTLKIHPTVVFPMHYGAVVGDVSMGEQFRQQIDELAPDITVVV